jgi:NodT family efflux transporter outer membrane factor (OMF) lipoprotein
MPCPEPFVRRPPRGRPWRALAILVSLVAGCAVGPDYVRPEIDIAAAYKEAPGWKIAEPRAVDGISRWWESYGDPTLDELVAEADAANQNLRQAEAQYRQAQALADATRAGFWPGIGASVGAGRATATTGALHPATALSAGLSASWEPDLWGGVRRAVEAGTASAQASDDDLAAARLSIRSALAQDYLQLRYLDVQRNLYANTNIAYARALKLTQSQFAAGVALRSDVALAETQLKSTQAAAADLDAQRAQLEHAIAILAGRAPAQFSLAPLAAGTFRPRLPEVPSAVPSDLLERRPDVAAAERRAAAANAAIGVARAAYYPALTLSASGAGVAGTVASLFDTPGRVWSLGATLAQTLFDGGLREARSAAAVAAYDSSVAEYKQTVLNGFQQVEDDLATLAVLERETTLQDEAVQAARLAEQLALAQYRGGTASYLAVITAQALALANQRTAVQLRSRQLTTSVALVAALGGGWVAPGVAAAPAPGGTLAAASTSSGR